MIFATFIYHLGAWTFATIFTLLYLRLIGVIEKGGASK